MKIQEYIAGLEKWVEELNRLILKAQDEKSLYKTNYFQGKVDALSWVIQDLKEKFLD